MSIVLAILLHLTTCFWIWVGIYNPNSWVYNSTSFKIDYFVSTEPGDGKFTMEAEVYITGLQIISQTLTTIGYGDASVTAEIEKFIIMLVQFAGILVVAQIQQRMFHMQVPLKIDNLIKEKEY